MTRMAIVSASALALAAGVVRADAGKTLPAGPAASRALTGGSGAGWRGGALPIYETGFEAGAGFTAGPLDGGNGSPPEGPWASNAESDPVISAAHPAAGAQHLRHLDDPAVPANTSVGGFSPIFPTNLGPSTVSFDFSISAVGGADYDVVLQSPGIGNASVTARVKFYFGDLDDDLVPGDILVLAADGMGGVTFIPTGAAYTPGPDYQNFRLEVDPVADNIDYFLEDVLIHSGPVLNPEDPNPGAIDQIVTLDDQFQEPGETGDFDNFRVAPEPASAALLALAALLVARRRTGGA